VATTVSPAPASLTATTTSSISAINVETATSSSATASATFNGGGASQVCHNKNGEFAPFCKPDNGSSVWVGETYYVTWDATYFSGENRTVFVQANYVDSSGGGEQAFQSPILQNSAGFYAWTIENAWLKGLASNNITLYLQPIDQTAAFGSTGPILMVTTSPAPLPYQQPPTPIPKGQDLYIALPTVFGFILLCVLGGFFLNRRHRKIGLGNIMGRRNGYGVGKSRSQRLGLRKKKDAIALRDQELTSGGQYQDIPVKERESIARTDEVELGSLAGTLTEDRTDYFGSEIRRQEQKRY